MFPTPSRQLNRNAKGLATVSAIAMPFFKLLGMNPSVNSGSYNSLYTIASSNFSSEMNGKYFVPVAKIGNASKFTEDSEMAKKLWEWTEKEMRDKGLLHGYNFPESGSNPHS